MRKQVQAGPARAVISTRVSSDDQVKNYSLGTQERDCRDYAERRGFIVDRAFAGEGESAWSLRRPVFDDRLLPYCRESGGRIQAVIVPCIDRFSRHMEWGTATLRRLTELGVRLLTVDQEIDLTTPQGKLIFHNFLAIAQFHSDDKSEKVKRTMKAALESGRALWVPVGYLRQGTRRNMSLVIDQERAPLIRVGFELIATGQYTAQEVLFKLTAQGLVSRKGKKLTLESFSRLLRNPVYVGKVNKAWGVDRAGSHEAIADLTTWERVQAVLDGRRPTFTPHVRGNPNFPLNSFVYHRDCGLPLSGYRVKKESKQYGYYTEPPRGCKPGVNVAQDKLEGCFLTLLKETTPAPDLITCFHGMLRREWERQAGEARALRQTLERRVAELRDRKKRLTGKLIDGTVSDADYREASADLDEKIATASAEVEAASIEDMDVDGVLGYAEGVLSDPVGAWKGFPHDQRQRFQRLIFPDGLTFSTGAVLTPRTGCIFSYFQGIGGADSHLASPTEAASRK